MPRGGASCCRKSRCAAILRAIRATQRAAAAESPPDLRRAAVVSLALEAPPALTLPWWRAKCRRARALRAACRHAHALGSMFVYKRRVRTITTILTPPKQAPRTAYPNLFHTRSPKQGIKNKTLSYRWMASLRETIHPHKFFNRWCRQSLNRNPKGDPTI